MYAVPAAVETVVEGLARLLYPPVCAGCGGLVPGRFALPLCPACFAGLERADAGELAAFLAAREVAHPTVALWRFDRGGAFQKVHHGLKYEGKSRYGTALGRLVGEAFGEALRGVLVPIPLHRRRLLERGYNQSLLIARGMADVTGLPVAPDGLARLHYARTQTRLGRKGRALNVAHAFEAPPGSAWQGQRAILVDDILTTGATLTAAAQALERAGAAGVQQAVVAWAR